MSYYQPLRVQFFEHTFSWRKKRTEWLVTPNGRWGPSWLHRLVWRAAKNLGMLRHDRTNLASVTVATVDLSRGTLAESMRAAVVENCNRFRWRPDDLEIIVGQREFMEMASQPNLTEPLHHSLPGPFMRGGIDGYRILGVAVRVLPNVSGFAVIPLSKDPAHDPLGSCRSSATCSTPWTR